MFSEILAKVHTVDDQLLLLQHIDLLLNSMYKLGDLGFEPTLEHDIPQSVADLLRSAIASLGGDKAKALEKLRAEVAGLQELNLEVAFEPSKQSIQQIYDWIAKNTTGGFIISLTINPSLVAGATLSYKGKFYNGSLKEQILKQIDKQNEE